MSTSALPPSNRAGTTRPRRRTSRRSAARPAGSPASFQSSGDRPPGRVQRAQQARRSQHVAVPPGREPARATVATTHRVSSPETATRQGRRQLRQIGTSVERPRRSIPSGSMSAAIGGSSSTVMPLPAPARDRKPATWRSCRSTPNEQGRVRISRSRRRSVIACPADATRCHERGAAREWRSRSGRGHGHGSSARSPRSTPAHAQRPLSSAASLVRRAHRHEHRDRSAAEQWRRVEGPC
jgi:hypothetical protein